MIKNVLLVDDDTEMLHAVKEGFERYHESFTVLLAEDGLKALEVLKQNIISMVVTDLKMPNMDGFELLAHIMHHYPDIPVIIITGYTNIDDAIEALRLGANDFIKKPFDMDELSARLRVLERRLSTEKTSEIHIGTVVLDTAAHQVSVDGLSIDLSRREYMLLKALMENSGTIQTRDALESKLYGAGEEVGSNAIEVHIHNLRKKLDVDLIKTVRGIGYTVKKQ